MPARILIADDNPRVRTALIQLLSDIPSEFIEAADGEEAVAKANELHPDIAIIDLAMPAMDGLSAAREILKVHPEMPIFLCTMHCSPHVDLEAKTSGIRKVVSKAQSSILIAAIHELLKVPESPTPVDAIPLKLPPNPTLMPAPAAPASSQPSENGDSRPAADAITNAPRIRRIG